MASSHRPKVKHSQLTSSRRFRLDQRPNSALSPEVTQQSSSVAEDSGWRPKAKGPTLTGGIGGTSVWKGTYVYSKESTPNCSDDIVGNTAKLISSRRFS
eukprot:scaffold38773_cov43-Cyclotella_meneghiniana.AAC.3